MNEYQVVSDNKDRKVFAIKKYYRDIIIREFLTFSLSSQILIGRRRRIILADPFPPYFVFQADHGLLG